MSVSEQRRGFRFIRPGLVLAAALIVSAPLTASAAPSGWRAQKSGTEEHLHGVFALDRYHAWAVGEEPREGTDSPGQSVIVATTDGGAHWVHQSFPDGTAQGTTMNRVLFTDTNHGYAVGEANSDANGVDTGKPNILRTSDGGKRWTSLMENLPSEGYPNGINDIEGLTARGSKVWITVASYPKDGQDGDKATGVILYSRDRGTTWTQQAFYSDSSFDSVSMADARNGWATTNDSYLWRTTDGGETWVKGPRTAARPEQVQALDRSRAVIVEESGHIEYTTDGTILHTASVPAAVGKSDLTDVSIGENGVGYATGELGHLEPTGGVLRTTNGGRTWTLEDANIPSGDTTATPDYAPGYTYNGVSVAEDGRAAFIVGEGGAIGARQAPPNRRDR
jgi:photosystem II stability/assembly factor-like uncharacterized protein